MVIRGMRSLRGFSLLEMLVVLVLLGLMVSLVGGRVQGPLEGAARQFELDVIAQWLGDIGSHARALGEGRTLTKVTGGLEGAPVQVASGWTLEFDPPLRVSAFGTCSDSEVTARYASSASQIETRFRVLALNCRIAKGDAY